PHSPDCRCPDIRSDNEGHQKHEGGYDRLGHTPQAANGSHEVQASRRGYRGVSGKTLRNLLKLVFVVWLLISVSQLCARFRLVQYERVLEPIPSFVGLVVWLWPLGGDGLLPRASQLERFLAV